MKYLFLDDIRSPEHVTWVDIGDHPWEIVRSFDEAVVWVKINGFPNKVAFDHDLGFRGQYIHASGLSVVTDDAEEKSGYDFAIWLAELDMNTGSMPEDFSFVIHSQNPIGAENIRMYLSNYIRQK